MIIMKNLAGHDVSIFLFRFEPLKGGIDFVLNEDIAKDLYPETGLQLQPLIQACGETLIRYKGICNGKIIMDGNVLLDGCFEVMLSPGLGKYFAEREKQNIFNDAHKIAKILMDVMDRRTKEIQSGTYPGPQAFTKKICGKADEGLEALGQQERGRADKFDNQGHHWPNLKQLALADLPEGVVAKLSYDHRGCCLAFTHKTFGYLGKVVVSSIGTETLMETELSIENPQHLEQKKAVLKEIVAVLQSAIRNTIPL